MKRVLYVLLVLLLLGAGAISSAAGCGTGVETGYHTLRGEIYEEGTGEAALLVFNTGDESYLLTNEDKVKNLQGLPLVLTGRVTRLEEGPFQGKITVLAYDTYYEEDSEEAAVLGRLLGEEDELVMLSRDQTLFELDSASFHSLKEHVGKEMVLTGLISQEDDYRGGMEVKSYRIID